MNSKNSPLPPEYIISQSCTQFPVQFEIDSIRLFIGWQELQDYDFEFLMNLVKGVEVENSFSGFYFNFMVKKSEKGITLSGSISNFFVGHTKILDFVDLPKAIDKLGKALKLDIHSARLYRLDFNWNVRTDFPPDAYKQSLFIDLPRFRRIDQGDGVKFKTKNKRFIIYDKTLELLETKGLSVPNWLRLEFKILRGVKNETGIIQMKDLYLKENYLKISSIFIEKYHQIKKRQVFSDDPDLWKNWKMLSEHLIFLGCESYGGLEKILEEIDIRSKMGSITNRNQKSRLKANIIRARDFNVNSRVHPLIKELDQKLDRDYKNLLQQLS